MIDIGSSEAPERILDKIMPEPNSGCWLWIGARTGKGYGNIWMDGSYQPAHRLIYSYVVGSIPDDLQIDHLCRVRACVNPKHLEPVTARTNLLRGSGPTATRAEQTECVNGHAFDADNTMKHSGRRHSIHTRSCRICHATRSLMRYYAKKVLHG